MLSVIHAADRPVSRLATLRSAQAGLPSRRIAAATLAGLLLSLAGFAGPAELAGAQQYGQQPSGDPAGQYPGAGQSSPQDGQGDPPSRVARLSLTQGTVSVQLASVQDFSPAEVNYPLTTGDRLWADAGSLAELQLGQVAVRLGQQTDFTVTGLTDTLAQFGLAQGSVHLRTFSLDPGTTTELDTPNAAVTVLEPGDLRVDVYPANNLSVFTLLSGAAQVDAQGFSQQLRPGESLQVTGSDSVSARDGRRPREDGLDGFSANQDSTYQASLAAETSYVGDGTIGASDLSSNGDWNPDPDYGPVWFPRGVAVGWQPYRNGHWAYVGPWGWTWIASERWGFAPFHYGRWSRFGGRWGWIPGPRVVRPVYSPALVAFVGGGSDVGVTAWFPLGPREPFQPWYRSSDRYVTRVNVTNIYNRNTVEVRNTYGNAGRGPSPFRFDPGRQYINRPATVAVPQGVFAGGRPVHNAELRVDPGQFSGATVLMRPAASPTRSMQSPQPARALPPQLARPQWQSRTGGQEYPRGGPQNGYGGNPSSYPDRLQHAPVERGPANPALAAPSQPGAQGFRDPAGAQRGGQPQNPGQQAPGQQPVGSPASAAPFQQPGSGFRRPGSPQRDDQPGRGDQPGTLNPQGPARGSTPTAPMQTAPSQPAQPNPAQRTPPPAQPPVQSQPAPGYRGPVGSPRGGQPDTPIPQQPGQTAAPRERRQSAPLSVAPLQNTERPVFNGSNPPQPRPSFDQRPSERQQGEQPQVMEQRRQQMEQQRQMMEQQRQQRDQQRQGGVPQPGNSVPQNRPAPPPMQYIPRPSSPPPSQPQQPLRQPAPAAQPQPNRPAPSGAPPSVPRPN